MSRRCAEANTRSNSVASSFEPGKHRGGSGGPPNSGEPHSLAPRRSTTRPGFAVMIDPRQVLGEAIAEAIETLVDERLGALRARQDESSPFVTVDEAARILRCDRQRIYDLASAGRLPRVKEGGRTLHRRAD